jgi:hypothetical protein
MACALCSKPKMQPGVLKPKLVNAPLSLAQ